METKDIVELATLIGGAIISIYGAFTQIKKRREDDAALEKAAGPDALAVTKVLQDITAIDPTYLDQVQAHVADTESRLAAARRLLRQHGISEEPTHDTQGE